MSDKVAYELHDAVAIVKMDDGKANALGFEMFEALNEAFDRAEADGAAVVLTGREGRFSAGFDLAVMGSFSADTGRLVKTGFEFAHRMLSFERPVVAAVGGHAMAMGLFVVLSTDYRVGVAGAAHKLQANEVAIGLTMPRAALAVCRHRIPLTHFERVVVMAEAFSPDTALAAGLLDALVPADEVLDAAVAKARELASLPARAFGGTKLRSHEATLAALREGIAVDEADFAAAIGAG